MSSLNPIIDAYLNMLNGNKTEEEFLEEKLITFGGQAYPKFGHVVIMAGGAGCFSGDTQVRTESGYKPIKDVSIGESVYTFSEETDEESLQKVRDVLEFTDHPEDMLELEFLNEDGKVETVRCTANHEFYVDGQWVAAKDLEIGLEF